MGSWETPYAAARCRKLSDWVRRRTSGQPTGSRRRYRRLLDVGLAGWAAMRGKYAGNGKGCCVGEVTPHVRNSRIRRLSGPLSLLTLMSAMPEIA
jgi:hypothetical protein